MPRGKPGAVYVSGLHRLSALKRLMTNITGMTFYAPSDGEPGPFMLDATLPATRITISLTEEAWRGYSGEGALLTSLAGQDLLEDAESIDAMLGFDPVVDIARMAKEWSVGENRLQAALAYLAVSGKLGYDAHHDAFFHRELPDDPDRVLKDNPRLVAARKLVDKVRPDGENLWFVHSNDSDYRVTCGFGQEAKCTCTWYLNHQNKRGPCKHILAVQLKEEDQ